MRKLCEFASHWVGGVLAVSVGMAVLGCGGEPTSATPPETAPVTKPEVAKVKGQNKKLARGQVPPEAEKTARDRINARRNKEASK